MNVCKVETDDPSPSLGVCRPIDLQVLHSAQCFECVLRYSPVVISNVPQTKFCQVVGRCSESNCACDVSGSSFELERRVLECGFVEMYFLDHFSPSLIGLHFLQELSLSVQDPYSGGSAHFVARKGEEIAI